MWRRWSSALERLGRFGFRLPTFRRRLRVGDPNAPDAMASTGWRAYLESEKLYDVWGPLPGSPWVPFHCVPLFAALDRLRREEVGPTPPPEPGYVPPATWVPGGAPATTVRELPPHARPGAPEPLWLTADTWTILDLPGPLTVEAAAWFVTAARCQPVCTFDNWPHERGLLRVERTLAELLRWATTIASVRPELSEASPPLWICDSERLGGRVGAAGEFDNRYYLDDSILPGPALLRQAGVRRVVYATIGATEVPVLDLEAYFADLLAAGLAVLHVDLADADAQPARFSAPSKPRKPPRAGFRRSAAGGFGTDVPEPSSGGSSG